MKIAVITPFHNTPKEQFDRCLSSVREQTVACDHIIVDDGSNPPLTSTTCQVIRLPQAHADTGNAARAIGSVSAVCQGYDAIAFLDSDNWYDPIHIESLLTIHSKTGAGICTSTRNLYSSEGNLLGICPEIDGDKFVDTNCMMFTRAGFQAIALWYLIPPNLKLRGDRFVWNSIRHNKITRAHTGFPTVGYRTMYRLHYEYFKLPPPKGAYELIFEDDGRVTKIIS